MDVLQRWIWTNIQVNEGMTGDDVNLNGGSNSLLHSLYNIKRFTKSADHASVGIVFGGIHGTNCDCQKDYG